MIKENIFVQAEILRAEMMQQQFRQQINESLGSKTDVCCFCTCSVTIIYQKMLQIQMLMHLTKILGFCVPPCTQGLVHHLLTKQKSHLSLSFGL